jgi:hypothetical protein
MRFSCVEDIWLVAEPDGLKVKVRLSGKDEYITVINETKVFNEDGSPSLISHNVSSSGIEAKADNKSAVEDVMIFSNEFWKLVITPQYVRKDNTKMKVNCCQCNGSGLILDPDAVSFLSAQKKCFYCWGDGTREVLPNIPPPPEMDQKFLADLREWFQNYNRN